MPKVTRVGACITMGPADDVPDTVFTEPTQEADAAHEEVEKWFERARLSGMSGINLYFEPYRKAFRRLSKRVMVAGYDVSLISYRGGLYRMAWGPGDSDEQLWYIGRLPKKRKKGG